MEHKLIPLAVWAKKNGYSRRHALRLAKMGRIPIQPLTRTIQGVSADFTLLPYDRTTTNP